MRPLFPSLPLLLVLISALTGGALGCSAPCTCTEGEGAKVVMVCSARGLTAAPAVPPNVSVLILDGNAIASLDEASFPTRLENLVELHLQNNKLQSIGSKSFANIPALKRLYLSSNNLETLGAGAFAGLTALQELFLDANSISSIASGAFSDPSASLTTLILDSNPLKTLPSNTLAGASRLTSLRISNGALGAIPDGLFADCSRLERLFLEKQALNSLSGESLKGLSALRLLALNANKFTEIHTSWLAHTSRLEQLELRSNTITKIVTENASIRLQDLNALLLRNNLIENVAPDMFAAFPALTDLEMTGNPSDCAMLEGALSCTCSSGRSGPATQLASSSPLKQTQYCVADACVSRSRNAGEEPCIAAGACWAEGSVIYESNVCKCFKHRVDCTALGIKSLPSGIPSSTAQLFLSMNDLKEFPDLRAFEDLYLVDLRSNRIEAIPEATSVLPNNFWPLSTDNTFNMSAVQSLADHAPLEPVDIAGATQTFGPTAIVPGLAYRAATFTGQYAFGGVGTTGNPSKCGLEYSKTGRSYFFKCDTCAPGFQNKGSSCLPITTPPMATLTLTSAAVGPSKIITNTSPITYALNFDFPVKSARNAPSPLGPEDLILSGINATASVSCSDVANKSTNCTVSIIPAAESARSGGQLVVVLPRGAATNGAGYLTDASVSHSVLFDPKSPSAVLLVQSATPGALAGKEPVVLSLRFSDGPVVIHPLDLARILQLKSSTSHLPAPVLNSTPKETSDGVWELRVLLPDPSESNVRSGRVTVTLPKGALTDSAGNALAASSSLAITVSAPCGENETETAAPTATSPRVCTAADGSSSNSAEVDDGWLFWFLVIGVPLIALLIIIVLILLICCLRRRNRRPYNFDTLIKETKSTLFQPDPAADMSPALGCLDENYLADMAHNATIRRNMIQAIAAPKEYPRKQVRLVRKIGKGFFGEVHLGELCVVGRETRGVVVKICKHSDSTRAFMADALVMTQVTHPNIVKLVGVVTSGMPTFALFEYMENESLDKFLRARSSGVARLHLDMQLKITQDILAGMAYLESVGLIHRDLAARNVLLDECFKCKISDFGLVRKEDTHYVSERFDALPVRWMAPEALQAGKFSSSSDVWAFGITVFEIFTFGRVPYEGWTNNQVLSQVLHGFRLPRPVGMPESLYDTLTLCWSAERCERPSFYIIKKQFAVSEVLALSPTTRKRLESEVNERSSYPLLLHDPNDSSHSSSYSEEPEGATQHTILSKSVSAGEKNLAVPKQQQQQQQQENQKSSTMNSISVSSFTSKSVAQNSSTVVDVGSEEIVRNYKPHEYVDLVDWEMPLDMVSSKEDLHIPATEDEDESRSTNADRSHPSNGYITIEGAGESAASIVIVVENADEGEDEPVIMDDQVSVSNISGSGNIILDIEDEEEAIAEEEKRIEEDKKRLDADFQRLQEKIERERAEQERQKREMEEREEREKREQEKREREAKEQREQEEKAAAAAAAAATAAAAAAATATAAAAAASLKTESAWRKPEMDDDEEEERKRRRRKEKELEAKLKAEQDKGVRKWEVKKKEELKQFEEERKRLDEEVREREEARQRQEEEMRKAEELRLQDARRKDEERRKRDEEMKRRETDAKAAENERKREEEQRRQKEEEIKRMEEEMRRQEEEMHRMEQELEAQMQKSRHPSTSPAAASSTTTSLSSSPPPPHEDAEAAAIEAELAQRERERAARRAARKAKEEAAVNSLVEQARPLAAIAETQVDEALESKSKEEERERVERRAARKAAAEKDLLQQQQQQQQQVPIRFPPPPPSDPAQDTLAQSAAPVTPAPKPARKPPVPLPANAKRDLLPAPEPPQSSSTSSAVAPASVLATSTPINPNLMDEIFSPLNVSPLSSQQVPAPSEATAGGLSTAGRKPVKREGDLLRPLKLDSAFPSSPSPLARASAETPRALPRRKTTGDKRPTLGGESSEGGLGSLEDDSELREILRRRERRSEKRT